MIKNKDKRTKEQKIKRTAMLKRRIARQQKKRKENRSRQKKKAEL